MIVLGRKEACPTSGKTTGPGGHGGKVYQATDDEPLIIPEEAVVVAGSRSVSRGPGKDWGISLYAPVIVKYRDTKTDAKIQLEDLLR